MTLTSAGASGSVRRREYRLESHRTGRTQVATPETPPAIRLRRGAVSRLMGWREWVGLPDFGVDAVKAKVDTGAASSSLHAFRLERFTSEDVPMVRFEIHPRQRSTASRITVEAEVIDERSVRNPGGRQELRPVIEADLAWSDVRWKTEINLTRRDEMGFRMLLGRRALRRRFVVDPSHSYLGGRPSPPD